MKNTTSTTSTTRANSIPNSSKYLKHRGKPIPNSHKYLKGNEKPLEKIYKEVSNMNQNHPHQNHQQQNLTALEEELLAFGNDPEYVGYIYPDYDDYEGPELEFK